MTVRASPRKSWTGLASPTSPAVATLQIPPKRAPAWGLGSSSQRICSSARAPRLALKTGHFPHTAPSLVCAGHAPISNNGQVSPRFEVRQIQLFLCGYVACLGRRQFDAGANVEIAKTDTTAAEVQEKFSGERTLLIVEDDRPFLERLAKALEQRGFAVSIAETVADGMRQVEQAAPAFAVVDMRLGDGNGLEVISALKKRRPDARAIILTGYGNIATAVNAVKLGAIDYLAKPADADDVVAALLAQENKIDPPEKPMSADRVRWEHIQRIYELCDRNVSETARRLSMHRRTLQRILAKRAPR